jgi:Ca-activated chloride channel homolog
MDSSGSMISTDVSPNRLDAAKEASRTFVTVVPDQLRVGLVGFASVADVLSWPTTDRDLVRGALREIQPTGATAIGDGLMKALRLTGLLSETEQLPADPHVDSAGSPIPTAERLFAVLLLSDGRNNAGRVRVHEAVTSARRLGVPVFTVALGTTRPGEPETVPGVVEPVDTRTLRTIADRTGGAFFSAPDDRTLNAVYEDLGSRIGYELRNEEITFAFAGGAFVLLFGATLLSMLRRPALP